MPDTQEASEMKRMAFLIRDFQVQIENLTSKMNEMIGEINNSQGKIKALEAWKADHDKKELVQGQARFDSPQQHMPADPYREEQMRILQQQQAMMGGAPQQMPAPQMMAQPQHHAMPTSAARPQEPNVSIEKMFYYGNKK